MISRGSSAGSSCVCQQMSHGWKSPRFQCFSGLGQSVLVCGPCGRDCVRACLCSRSVINHESRTLSRYFCATRKKTFYTFEQPDRWRDRVECYANGTSVLLSGCRPETQRRASAV
ncbi:hypothetical protein LSTR_LSTR003741 [Laodelphax striatellus]|uniref:Uncharacterized protein n=1 Tax=Laodelphax striatellus TaxID=195883 RepID=A0A482WZQ8_LAOST|nr:hypothetical protein LSTR_LSTR003741 [Laodelphax striatellus]